MSSDLTPINPQHRGREYSVPFSVGIELEVEFDVPPPPLPASSSLHFKQDGSLTNGVEMVFRTPLPKTKLQEPADEMVAAIEVALQLTGGRVVLSPRAGTHFHVNVVGQTPLAAAKAFLLMCAIEPKLFELFPTRKENIFCLPSFMSDRPMMELVRNLKDGSTVIGWSNDMGHFRYAATNSAAIARYGSLEMRMVPTMIDSKKMARWGLTFANLVQTGCELSTRELCDSVADLSWLNRIVEDRATIEFPRVDTPMVHEHLDKIRFCAERLFMHERKLNEKKRMDRNRLHLGQPPILEPTTIRLTVGDMLFSLIEEGRRIDRMGQDDLRRLAGAIDQWMSDGPDEEEMHGDTPFANYSHQQLENTQNSVWAELERREANNRPLNPRPRFPSPPRPAVHIDPALTWATAVDPALVPEGSPHRQPEPANMTATDIERALQAMRDSQRERQANPPVIEPFNPFDEEDDPR